MDQEEMTDQITAACSQSLFHNQDQNSASRQPRSDIVMSSQSRWLSSTEDTDQDGLSNGTCEVETIVALHCPGDVGDATDPLALSNDGMSEFSNSDLSLPEVCISTNSSSFDEDMSYEVQQAYRIFTGFLLDKHKGITNSFLHPVGHQEAKRGVGAVRGWGQAQLKQSMCLRRMEEKFINQEYETITEFVADFRLMLENCYRYHGVDHWISKQAQKLEIMLEQKLTLLSRTLREKTTLAVTSKGRFGAEEERGSGGTSTRRRLAPRSLATITVGGHESIMVQTLRLEEQQRAKDEKRQRELEKKEAEEMSAKEVEEWEQSLLSQASPHSVDTLWELPAIGHFLCLAQTALNLPEIVFFELERCLLMPRCSTLLSKIMSSLLCPPQRRATLHRRPALPYCHWESELRQRVMSWYRAIGASRNQPGRAEQLGLCHQFFRILGTVSPLEEKPFHLLPFYQRVWLLKGLCDHVYETQKDVQDALLSQPIHECRESILGYDSKENAYIHFPHFCGADLRIYCQSPSTPPTFPFPSIKVKRVETEPEGTEGEDLDDMKDGGVKRDTEHYGGSVETGDSEGFGNGRTEAFGIFERENGDREERKKKFKLWSLKKEEGSESGTSDGDSCDDSKSDFELHTNVAAPFGRGVMDMYLKKEAVEPGQHSLEEEEQGFSLGSVRTIKAETQEPCLSVGEHFYTGRSPARLVGPASPTKPVGGTLSPGRQRDSCSECHSGKTTHLQPDERNCCCGTSRPGTQLSSESAQNSSEERMNDKIWTKKKKRKKKRGREQLARVKGERRQLQDESRTRLTPGQAAKSALRRVAATIKRKDKKKKIKAGKKFESSRKIKDEPTVEPTFKLVCTSLDELRELISKTEDELDDLESTKKRLGRWYYRREAVKDLHSTLIRLLNELSPWEPKLAKAFQRNRLRLKKEFDDFKKHPEYKNFVREERTSSSSDEDDEERNSGKEACSLSDHHRRSEEEDMEHVVPRGLWSGANTREILAETGGESTGTHVSPSHLKHSLSSPEKGVSLSPRVHTGTSTITASANSGPQSRSDPIPSTPSQDTHSARATAPPAQVSQAPRPPIFHTTGLPKGYTPIPTLLAKSVGNKVTLMKRPDDYPVVNDVDGQSKGSLVFSSTSAVAATNLSKAQRPSFCSEQNTQQPQQTEVLRQAGMAMVTAALPQSPQVKPTQTVPKSPVQVVYKVPEGLGQLIRTDSSSPVKISVQPVMNQNIGDKIMQQVVILPPNLLIQKPEEKASTLHQQQAKSIQVPVSKVTSPLCMSTNVPGFTIPESRIPVQQVAPLKDARTSGTPSPSVSPCLPQGSMNAAVFNRAHVSSPRVSTTPGVLPCNTSYPSPVTSPSSAASTDSIKPTDPKQELKTVCIRDSQSILVTTRGGNTGIVKVQTSSDQNALGSLSASSVITISPQFKAFLVSKTSTTFSPSAPSQTSPSTTPAVASISVAQPQKQVPPALHSPPIVSSSVLPAMTGSVPVTGSGNQTASAAVPVGQGFTTPACSAVSANIGQLAQTAVGSSRFQAPLVKNTVVVPSLSSSGVLTQAEFMGKTGVKRPSVDERSQVTKFILVTPTSTSASNVAIPKGIPSPTKSHPGSRVMFISQPPASSSTTSVGSIPKLAVATGASGQLLTASLPNQTLKMGLPVPVPVPGHPAASVPSEALSKVKNIALPSGVQVQLSGKTTTIGQTIGALSRSPAKSAPVSLSDGGHPTVSGTGLVSASNSNIITNCPAQLSPLAALSSSSPLQGVTSFIVTSQPGSSTSTSAAPALTVGSMMKNDLCLPPNILSSKPLAQVTTTLQSRPAQTSTSPLVHQPSNIQSGIGEENAFYSSSSRLGVGKNQTAISTAAPANSQLSTSTAGTIQQRIVINTSSPLSAGTQILLNNTRFVVPPQGLGPGSHVLIISSPAPQQVPPAGATSTGSSLPPQGPGQVIVRAPALPQSPVRMPGPAVVNCPFVARTPAIGPSLLAATPNAAPPVRIAGTPGLGPAVLPVKTNVVSALTRLPAAEQTGSFASNPVGAPTLLSSLPRLGSAPAIASPVVTSATVRSAALPTIRLAAGTPTQSECSPTMPAVATPLLSRLSSFPVLPHPSVPTTFSSPAAPMVAGTQGFLPSPPAQPLVSVTAPGSVIHPQQTPGALAAPPAALSQTFLHTGLDSSSVKKTAPAVMQPLLAGPRTQVLPTVAVPPIVNTVSRMQALPIATVTPIGSTVNTFETAPVVTALSSSSTVIISPSQPITSLKMNSTFHPPVVLTGQAAAHCSLQPSSLGSHTSVASKLLISPDGAVLNTVQCQVSPADLTACPKPLDALMVSSNSSSGALHMHDSSLQSSQADRKCTN